MKVDAFEQEFAEYVGIEHCLAFSSGTAAMHLVLRILGVGQAPVKWSSNLTGQADEVIASTLTFIGSVTPVIFQGADLTFVDWGRSGGRSFRTFLTPLYSVIRKRGRSCRACMTQ